MKIDYSVIGSRIRQYRLEKGFTQEELALRINTSAQYISCIERGIKKPSLETLIGIAEVMDVTVNDFIYTVPYTDSISSEKDLMYLISMCTSEKQQIVIGCVKEILKAVL